MFDFGHIMYMLVSFVISAVIIILCKLGIKTEEGHYRVIRIFALLTVALHYSPLWVDFFREGTATVSSVMLLPIHPCNVCMWLLLAASLVKNRNTTAYRVLSEFVFWGGTVCGFIGILLNENYASTPSLLDYDVLKGLLSHSTMLIGCIYFAAAKLVRIRVFNVISVVCGLSLFVIDGAIINALYSVFGLSECNSMYLQSAPFPDMPWLNTLTMGLMGVSLVFVLTVIFEQINLPKEKRWYTLIKGKIQAIKEKNNA